MQATNSNFLNTMSTMNQSILSHTSTAMLVGVFKWTMVLTSALTTISSVRNRRVVLWASPVSTMCETQQETPLTCMHVHIVQWACMHCRYLHALLYAFPLATVFWGFQLAQYVVNQKPTDPPMVGHHIILTHVNFKTSLRHSKYMDLHPHQVPSPPPGTFTPKHEDRQKSRWFELQCRYIVEIGILLEHVIRLLEYSQYRSVATLIL